MIGGDGAPICDQTTPAQGRDPSRPQRAVHACGVCVCAEEAMGAMARTEDSHEDKKDAKRVTAEEGLAEEDTGSDGVEDDGEAAQRRHQRRGRVAERRQVEDLR